MQISNVSKADAIQMSNVLQLFYTGNRVRDSLVSAGITFEGEAFKNKNAAIAWLEVLAKDMARQIANEEKPEAKAKAKSKAKAAPKPAKRKKK